MRSIASLACIAFVVLAPRPAPAEGGFRCDRGRIIRKGETTDDVARKCGPADAVNGWIETRTESFWENGHAIERQVVIAYEEWKYDLGRNRLVRYLTFANGRLFSVATSGYGE